VQARGVGETGRFALVQVFFWAAVVSFEAFMVPWLRGHGYSPSQAGLVVAVVFGCAVVGQPILGGISDRVASPGRMVATALLIGTAAFVSMPLVVQWMPALLTLAAVYSLTIASLPAVLDAWIISRREVVPSLHYGIARGAGSFGFASGGIILGFLVDRTPLGVDIIFPGFALATLTAVAVALHISRRFSRARTNTGTHPTQHLPVSALAPPVLSAREQVSGAFRAVISNRPYLLLLLGSFLGFSGLRAALTFLPYLFDSVGGSVGHVGLAYSIGAISEVPFFVGAAYLHRRVRGAPLLSAVLLLMAVRLLMYTWMASPQAVLLLQISHGLTFGVFMATAVDYIHRIAPPEHRGFFQTLAPSVFFGIGSIVGGWLGGILMEATSIVWLYRTAALLALIGAPIPLLARPSDYSTKST
jgi:PPP family 3-phenylpropionic acid transporter